MYYPAYLLLSIQYQDYALTVIEVENISEEFMKKIYLSLFTLDLSGVLIWALMQSEPNYKESRQEAYL